MTFDLQFSLVWPEILLLVLSVIVLCVDMVRAPRRNVLLGTAAAGLGVLVLLMVLGRMGILLPWPEGETLHGQFIVDGFAQLTKIFLVLILLTVILCTIPYEVRLGHVLGEHTILVLLSGLGMLIMASANELIVLFVALELATIPLMILTALTRRDPESNEAAVKFLVAGSVASAFTIFGIALIWGFSGGTMNLGQLRDVISAGPVPAGLTIGLIFLFAGLGFKTAIAPFHAWVPDVYEGAPTPITAFLAGGSKAAGFAALTRVAVATFIPSADSGLAAFDWPLALAVLAGITAVVGNLAAMWQKNIKRLLAHASVGHAGFLLMGLAVLGTQASADGLTALGFYLVFYAVAVAVVFFVIGLVSRAGSGDTLADYEGLHRRAPGLTLALLIAILSMGGIPPLAGFLGKMFIVYAVVQGELLWLALIAGFGIILSIVYTLMILRALYIAPTRLVNAPVPIAPWERGALTALTLLLVVFGVFPAPVMNMISTAMQSLI